MSTVAERWFERVQLTDLQSIHFIGLRHSYASNEELAQNALESSLCYNGYFLQQGQP